MKVPAMRLPFNCTLSLLICTPAIVPIADPQVPRIRLHGSEYADDADDDSLHVFADA